jgi:hypothetical protein
MQVFLREKLWPIPKLDLGFGFGFDSRYQNLVHICFIGMIRLQLYEIKPFGTWQFGKIGVLVNVIIQKLKFC